MGRINLGLDNFRVELNDQYLCIVLTREAGFRLTFLEQRTTPIILSKAAMLADDAKISHLSILS